MKNYIALFTLVLILSVTSCSKGDTLNSKNEDAEQKTDLSVINTSIVTSIPSTSPEDDDSVIYDSLEFVNAEAEDLFNMIADNRSVWERENMYGATLMDLDFDGQPEFLLTYQDEGAVTAATKVFKFNENEFYEWFFIDNTYDMPRNISLYTDDEGKKGWVIPILYDGDGYNEDRMTFFDYTVNPFSETVILASRQYYTETNGETIYGDTEYFVNGSKLAITDEQLQNYLNADPVTLEWWAPRAEEDALKYYYTREYIHLTEDILNPATYSLLPGNLWWVYYEEPGSEYYSPHGILKPVSQIANAYVSNDYEFFSGGYSFGAAYKPVIYLYPEEETDIDVYVTFPHGGNFTCTYPDYGNGWNVTAHPDGTLTNKADGYEYYCLYWEGNAPFNWDFSRGFVIRGSETVEFLREKLLYMGLNQRECNEFIIYWLPLMQNNEYNLISFQTSAYTENAAVKIIPEPDSVLRVFMAYMPLDNPINIPEQQLNSFDRTGFAVIEWGGTCVD